MNPMIQTVTANTKQARLEGLEEAAKIVDATVNEYGSMTAHGLRIVAARIRSRIAELKSS